VNSNVLLSKDARYKVFFINSCSSFLQLDHDRKRPPGGTKQLERLSGNSSPPSLHPFMFILGLKALVLELGNSTKILQNGQTSIKTENNPE